MRGVECTLRCLDAVRSRPFERGVASSAQVGAVSRLQKSLENDEALEREILRTVAVSSSCDLTWSPSTANDALSSGYVAARQSEERALSRNGRGTWLPAHHQARQISENLEGCERERNAKIFDGDEIDVACGRGGPALRVTQTARGPGW